MDNYSKVTPDVKDILYSRTVKAGKRIYYLDVKAGRNNELYMSVTESKKRVSGDLENPEVSYEKHKIFVYQEDIPNFLNAMDDVLEYIHQNSTPVPPRKDWNEERMPEDPEEAAGPFFQEMEDDFLPQENNG